MTRLSGAGVGSTLVFIQVCTRTCKASVAAGSFKPEVKQKAVNRGLTIMNFDRNSTEISFKNAKQVAKVSCDTKVWQKIIFHSSLPISPSAAFSSTDLLMQTQRQHTHIPAGRPPMCAPRLPTTLMRSGATRRQSPR